MRRVINPNIEILEIAVSKLDDLVTRLVFLGGCATGLLMTDEAAPPIRSTGARVFLAIRSMAVIIKYPISAWHAA